MCQRSGSQAQLQEHHHGVSTAFREVLTHVLAFTDDQKSSGDTGSHDLMGREGAARGCIGGGGGDLVPRLSCRVS